MLLKFFRKTLPQVIVALIVLALFMWLKSFWSVEISPFYFDSIKMPFYAIMSNWLQGFPLLTKGLVFLVMIFTGFNLLQINSKHIVIKQRTYLPAFFYILFASSILSLQRINPAVFSALFLIYSFDHIFSIYQKESALDNLFKAGFFIALASLFYAPSLIYFIALLLSIISIRSFNIREWFAALFGVITPWGFFFLYHYLTSSDLIEIYKTIRLNYIIQVNQDYAGLLIYTYYAYGIALFLITGLFLIKTLPTQKINVRKYHGVFFWFNVVSVFALFIIPSISIEFILIAVIPLTFQLAHYFATTKRKFWPEFLFILLIAIVLSLQFLQ